MGLFGKKKKLAETEIRADETGTDDGSVSAEVLFSQIFGERITANKAMEIPAVARCVNMIAFAVSALPVKLYRKASDGSVKEITDDRRVKMLNGRTGDTLNATEQRYLWTVDYLLYGNAYGYIERGALSQRAMLYYVSPGAVAVKANRTDSIRKIYKLVVDGREYYPYQFLKIMRRPDGFGKGRGIVSENALALSVSYSTLKLEETLVKKGCNKKGFLKSAKHLGNTEIEKLKAAWRKLYCNEGDGCIVLNEGMDFKEASSTNVEMQLNENKKNNSAEIMGLFGTKDGILSDETVKNAVMPVLDAFEAAFDADLLDEDEKDDHYFAFDTRELTRGSIRERYEAYGIAIDKGFMQVDEARTLEDMKPLGIDFVKLSLADSFYDPKTKRIYTPNTNAWADFGAGEVTAEQEVQDSQDNADNSADTAEIEKRYNPNQLRNAKGMWCKDGVSESSSNSIDKSGKGGIIKSRGENMHISAIEQPIEQQHTGKGNPNAILMFDVELNKRQQELLDSLPEYDSHFTVPKDSVNMADLSALTAKTGDEFAMFTNGNERLIIRGNSEKVNVDIEQAREMAQAGYRWSGHTHPGESNNCLIPSLGDVLVLREFSQENGVIYNSKGQFATFGKE